MPDISNNLTTLDFDEIKNNLKVFLRSQSRFTDYDFEGSNLSVLLDILAYNTQMNAFYMNMISNEMFMDSAVMRDSIVSHAKELNYLPRSFRSAYANVNITVASTDPNKAFMTIPKGSVFITTSGSNTYSFTTDENIVFGGTDQVFVANNVVLYEGQYTTDSYVSNDINPVRYIIQNKTVDTTSVSVRVIEDNGSITRVYTQATSLFGLDSESDVFFIQAAENETYEIVFGDGVIGRKPKDRSVVIIEYRPCSGELPNGVRFFTAASIIDGESNIVIETNQPARGGAVSESIESIRFNAPRAFTTQERAITVDDYVAIMRANFAEVNDVSAYGGEEANPPQYGKVFISVDLKTTDVLPPSKKDLYYKFLKPRSPLSIDPVFIDPIYTYVVVNTKVRYDINQTSLSENEIKARIISSIISYNTNYIDGFKKTLRFSKLVAAIDASHFSVVSNNTELLAMKIINPKTSVYQNFDVDFGFPFRDDIPLLSESHKNDEISVISSSPFIFNGLNCFLEDDGDGIVRIMTSVNGEHSLVKDIGTVDYASGFVQLNSLYVNGLIGGNIRIYARTADADITSSRNVILSIRGEDINVQVERVRL